MGDQIKKTEMGRECGAHGARAEVHTGFLVWKPKGRRSLRRPGVYGKIILKWVFERLDGGTWTGSIWLRIGAGGGLL